MSAHPYAPAGLDLPGYVPLRLSQLEIVAFYLGASLVVLLSVWLISGRCRRISKADRVLMCWWAFTGLTHILIEGPFLFTPNFLAKGNLNYFDEVSKSLMPEGLWSMEGVQQRRLQIRGQGHGHHHRRRDHGRAGRPCFAPCSVFGKVQARFDGNTNKHLMILPSWQVQARTKLHQDAR
ncbi:hypothetical protein ACQJBY_062280 [Aegilops geniculata]